MRIPFQRIPSGRRVSKRSKERTCPVISPIACEITFQEHRLEIFLRKEVIQPQVPLRLPCYDFTPVADLTVADCPLAVGASSSGKTNSHGVTGGVYKARERIHRGELIHDY